MPLPMNRDALRERLVALGRQAARLQDERLGHKPSDEARASFQRAWLRVRVARGQRGRRAL
jgi:hypothetical protein